MLHFWDLMNESNNQWDVDNIISLGDSKVYTVKLETFIKRNWCSSQCMQLPNEIADFREIQWLF